MEVGDSATVREAQWDFEILMGGWMGIIGVLRFSFFSWSHPLPSPMRGLFWDYYRYYSQFWENRWSDRMAMYGDTLPFVNSSSPFCDTKPSWKIPIDILGRSIFFEAISRRGDVVTHAWTFVDSLVIGLEARAILIGVSKPFETHGVVWICEVEESRFGTGWI